MLSQCASTRIDNSIGLSEALSQSLAGRVGLLHLLPPGFDELQRFDAPPTDLLRVMWSGAYPRIHDRGVPPDVWLRDYVATYVQRDVRQVLNVTDLEAFSTFVRLATGRTVTYGGTEAQDRSDALVVPWNRMLELDWT